MKTRTEEQECSICPSVPWLPRGLSKSLGYDRIHRKSLVSCLAFFIFSFLLLSLFEMSTEILEKPSILISALTSQDTCCGVGPNRSLASCVIYRDARGDCLSHFCLVVHPL